MEKIIINKKDYLAFCEKMNEERGEWNDGYDIEEIEEFFDDEFEFDPNNSLEVEGTFVTLEEYNRFLNFVLNN